MRKKTTEEFIKKVKLVHGKKYDYSKVLYTGCFDEVKIICETHGEFSQVASNHLSGRGCWDCGNESSSLKQRNSKSKFIQKAEIVHGNQYDYSQVEYINNSTPVKIICETHGEFWQRPQGHLTGNNGLGSGCEKCGREKITLKLTHTTEQFIAKAKDVHGDLYDYSKAKYSKDGNNLTIICSEHGKFEQTPSNHYKFGCIDCGREKTRISRIEVGKASFFKLAEEKHGDKYDYSEAIYIDGHTEVTILCNKKNHPPFKLTPFNHANNGIKCPKCEKERQALFHLAQKSTTEEWIKKAAALHGDRYDYSLVEYVGRHDPVTIVCGVHGPFSQDAGSHINKKNPSGCPLCIDLKNSKGMQKIEEFLVQHKIDFERERTFKTLRYKLPLPLDFWLPKRKTVIEFDGEQHNPKRAKKHFWVKTEKRLRLIKKRDRIKNKWAKERGYKMIRIDYTEQNQIKKILLSKFRGIR
jgi:very-short-patch-repair endonuclease